MIPLLKTARRGWNCFRSYGGTETFCRVLHRFRVVTVNHVFDIWFKELDEKIDNPASHQGLVIREIFPNEIETLKYAEDLHYREGISPVKDLQEQFSRGMRFFAVLKEGVVIALNGINIHHADFVYLNKPMLPLPQGVVYFNAALTAPVYRNRRIGTTLREYVVQRMKEEGYHTAVAATFIENKGAAHWHRLRGFQYWGKIRYFRWKEQDFWWTQLTKVGRRYPNLLTSENRSRSHAQKLQEVVS